MIIGKNLETNKDCSLDLNKLIATRMLINSSSGGGKSWLGRRMMEQFAGKVQQIIIDLEGDFITLREKYDFLLVGKDGDIPLSIRTAETLATKLLELNTSAILDLSELKKHERTLFVKRFLESLIESPKKLWHPVLVYIDEAHEFCPESKSGKAESKPAVIDICTRGRKRGFGGILMTQRISKLSKDAVAELTNVFTGRTILDIDRKRASDNLGFTKKEQELSLRDLKDGEMFCFGSAFNHTNIAKIQVGGVQTTHPDKTKGIQITPPKIPRNIKKMLKDFINIPKEAEEELKTKDDMKKKIFELKGEIRILSLSKTKPEVDEKKAGELQRTAYKAGLNSQKANNELILTQYKKREKYYNNILTKLTEHIKRFNSGAGSLLKEELPEIKIEPKTKENTIELPLKEIKYPLKKESPNVAFEPKVTPNPRPQSDFIEEQSEIKHVKAGAMKMLNWLASSNPVPLSKQRLATLSGFSTNGGTFGSYISVLRKNGWLTGEDEYELTQEGLAQATERIEFPTGEQLITLWSSKFKAGVGKMLRIICEKYPEPINKDELAEMAGFEGGTFNSYLSKLKKNDLVEIEGDEITASKELME